MDGSAGFPAAGLIVSALGTSPLCRHRLRESHSIEVRAENRFGPAAEGSFPGSKRSSGAVREVSTAKRQIFPAGKAGMEKSTDLVSALNRRNKSGSVCPRIRHAKDFCRWSAQSGEAPFGANHFMSASV